MAEELAKLREEQEQHVSEVANLRKQASLSQQNWITERDDLIAREAYAKEEFENAKQAMQDWEALALNERSLHDNLKEKMVEVEEQMEALREAHARAVSERDQNSEAVDGLQKALQRLQAGKTTTPGSQKRSWDANVDCREEERTERTSRKSPVRAGATAETSSSCRRGRKGR